MWSKRSLVITPATILFPQEALQYILVQGRVTILMYMSIPNTCLPSLSLIAAADLFLSMVLAAFWVNSEKLLAPNIFRKTLTAIAVLQAPRLDNAVRHELDRKVIL
jgi:hypothetical protein